MPFPDRVEMHPKEWNHDARKNRDPILTALSGAHHDLAAIEVEILNAEP